MRTTRYITILLFIAVLQLFCGWPFSYTPELLYIVAFSCALNSTPRQTLAVFFIAGIISDLFIGQHLGVNTLTYFSSGLLLIYGKKTLPSTNSVTHILLMSISLIYIFLIRFLLAHFSFQLNYSLDIILNNLLFTLLLAPALSLILELPLICPWKKSDS